MPPFTSQRRGSFFVPERTSAGSIEGERRGGEREREAKWVSSEEPSRGPTPRKAVCGTAASVQTGRKGSPDNLTHSSGFGVT